VIECRVVSFVDGCKIPPCFVKNCYEDRECVAKFAFSSISGKRLYLLKACVRCVVVAGMIFFAIIAFIRVAYGEAILQ
jgi:hypothetical protein